MLPGERLVDTHRLPLVIDEQVVRVGRPAQRHAIQRRARLDVLGTPRGLGAGRNGAWERGLVAKTAGAVDGAQDGHQDRHRADGVKAVGVGRQTAHGVEGHRVAGDGLVLVAPGVGPGDGQLDLLVAGGDAHFVGQPANGCRRNAGNIPRPLGGVLLHPLLEQLEGGLNRRAVREAEVAQQVGIGTGRMGGDGLVQLAVPPQFVLRIEAALLGRHFEAHEHAVLRALFVEVHQLGGVGVLDQEFAVVEAGLDDLVGQRQHQRTVGARFDRDPFIGNGRIAGAHRVDRNEPAAVSLELGKGHLHRVGVVILGGADHHEQLGPVQVGATEFPEGATDGINHACGHVDRAEATVGGIVRGAKLLGEQAGQCLHLVTAGEQREFFGVGLAQVGKPLLKHVVGFIPGDRLELGIATIGSGLPFQGAGQAGRGILLHDARGSLGADYALVQRVVRVALDVAHFAIAERDANPATARAHVTRGIFDFGATLGRILRHVTHKNFALWGVFQDRGTRLKTALP